MKIALVGASGKVREHLYGKNSRTRGCYSGQTLVTAPGAEELIPPRLSCPSKNHRARWGAIFFEDSHFLSWIYRLDEHSMNHPNFADPSGDLSSASLFGVSTQMANAAFNGVTNGLRLLFRIGGPRSLQLSLRFNF